MVFDSGNIIAAGSMWVLHIFKISWKFTAFFLPKFHVQTRNKNRQFVGQPSRCSGSILCAVCTGNKKRQTQHKRRDEWARQMNEHKWKQNWISNEARKAHSQGCHSRLTEVGRGREPSLANGCGQAYLHVNKTSELRVKITSDTTSDTASDLLVYTAADTKSDLLRYMYSVLSYM